LNQFLKSIAIGFVKFYQMALSPFLGNNCRYVPTCSAYAVDAIQKYGAAKGSWMAIKRIGRCRPGGGHGWDPVK
jgi:uncharacterized protein